MCDALRNLVAKVKEIDIDGVEAVLRDVFSPDLSTIRLESEDAVVYRYLSRGAVAADLRRTTRIAELGIAVEPPGDILRKLLGLGGVSIGRRLYIVISYSFHMDTVFVRARWDGESHAFFHAEARDGEHRVVRSADSGVEAVISAALARCLGASSGG